MMKRQQHSKVTILLVMDEMQGMTLNGIKEEFKRGKYIKDVNKIAMVSDEKWIKKSLKLESLIPEIEIEHFPIKNKSKQSIGWKYKKHKSSWQFTASLTSFTK
jgi:SpoIIAA-like